MAEIRVGDIGTVFEVTLKDGSAIVDLSSATTKEIWFRTPMNKKLTKTAVFVTDGTDGKLQYTAETGFLDQEGTWKLQAHVVLSSGTWHSEIGTFKVFGNL